MQNLYQRRRDQMFTEQLTNERVGNWHKPLGIVGLSRIGRRVIDRLRQFYLVMLAHDPYLSPADAARLGVRNLPLDEVIRRAEVLSLHAPAPDCICHMMDVRRLALLRDGCTRNTTACGNLVDKAALTRELVSGRKSVVIDATEPEILSAAPPLYDLPRVFLTPHNAGAVGRERERLGEVNVTEVERPVKGDPPAHQGAAVTLHSQA